MNVGELITQVIDETGYSFESTVRSAVLASIKTTHSAANFDKDLIEDAMQLSNPGKVVRIATPDRLRHLEAIVIVNEYGEPIANCTQTTPGAQLRDMSGISRAPEYYVSGYTYTVMSNRLNIDIKYLYLNMYLHPDLSGGTETQNAKTTWITEQYPEVIIAAAKGRLYKMMGDIAQSDSNFTLATDGIDDIIATESHH